MDENDLRKSLSRAKKYLEIVEKLVTKSGLSKEDLNWWESNSSLLQREAQRLGHGIIGYKLSYNRGYIPRYQLFANFPVLLQGGDQDDAIQLIPIVKQSLRSYIQELNEILEDPKRLKKLKEVREEKELSNRIFIVHGHNETMKQSVARLLKNIRLEPIILHEQPNKGRTIIEKIEDYSDVGFAVILFSPDDKIFSMKNGPKNGMFRARQNVILELGYFIGKLGRDKVAVLYLEDKNFEFPSDIFGILYLSFDSTGTWKYKLIDELKSCGFNVSKDDIK